MNKEQEHLIKIYTAEFLVKRFGKQADKLIILINKQMAIMTKLDAKNGFISSIRWMIAYKRHGKKLAEVKALFKLTKVQLNKWSLLLEEYNKNFF